MRQTLAAIVVGLAVAAATAPAHAANQDLGSAFVTAGDLAGDGSNDLVTAGGTSTSPGSPGDIAAARVNLDGSFVAAAGGGDGRVVHDLGGNEFAIDVAAGPGTSVTFAGVQDGNVLIGRLNAALGLDPSCAGDGADARDLGGIDRGDLIARDPAGGYVVAGVRDGVAFVIRFNSDCSFDAAFGVRELDFGMEGEVVAVHDILIDEATGEIVLAVELDVDGGVVVLEGDGDADPTFAGNGLLSQDLGTSFDRLTGLVRDGGTLIVAGDDGTTGEVLRIDGAGNVVTGPVSFDLGPGADFVNGVTRFAGGELLAFGSVPDSGFSDSAAALLEPAGFTLLSGFAGDGNNTFDPGGGLNVLNDAQAVNGVALLGAVVDNPGTQSFDFGLGAVGQNGQLAPAFNGGQFLLIDFTGQTSESGGAPVPVPPSARPDLLSQIFESGNPAPGNVVAGQNQEVTLVAGLANTGLAPALSVTFTIDLPDGYVLGPGEVDAFLELADRRHFDLTPVCSPTADGRQIVCRILDEFAALPPGATVEVTFSGRFTQLGDRVVTATPTSTTPDENPRNDATRKTVEVGAVPDSRIGRITPIEFSGTTTRESRRPTEEVLRLGAAGTRPAAVRRVDVAVLRGRARRGRCAWLRTRRATFRRRACSNPIWHRARGTRRWRYRLRRALRPGRYTLYVRATNAAGISERVFTPRDGNRRSFRVRRRR